MASFLWTWCSTSLSVSRPRTSAASAPSAGHSDRSPPTRPSSRRTQPATRSRSSWRSANAISSMSWTCPAVSSSGCPSQDGKP
ncbi:hypothetical protein HU200_036013 [Digitaria exilis]|uniref:Uncharacterized protein n=1 Tax=Digitaria exilis TaxID=1010633 RepID=A0A835BGV5_9POAL|nr:hypothetical protein HU200_036013 [Digitaria exilis]